VLAVHTAMSAADAIAATVASSGAEGGIPSVPFSFVVEVAKYCVGVLLALAFLDYFFARQWQGRYFVLHTAANAAIALAVLPDVFNIVTDPVSTLRLTSCWAFPTGACFAIHFYHMLAPGFVLYSVDWLHHILMVVLGCPCIIAGQVGPLMNFNLFFICGVPGGIDYLMLALVKERLMLPLTEKKHNNTIQVSDAGSLAAGIADGGVLLRAYLVMRAIILTLSPLWMCALRCRYGFAPRPSSSLLPCAGSSCTSRRSTSARSLCTLWCVVARRPINQSSRRIKADVVW
jgi:hypothetical protein